MVILLKYFLVVYNLMILTLYTKKSCNIRYRWFRINSLNIGKWANFRRSIFLRTVQVHLRITSLQWAIPYWACWVEFTTIVLGLLASVQTPEDYITTWLLRLPIVIKRLWHAWRRPHIIKNIFLYFNQFS